MIKLIDLIERSWLFEMAYSRKTISEKIFAYSNNINTHLIYLLLYPNSTTKNHWKNEISNWLFLIGVMTVKPNNKKLKKDFYFEKLFVEPFETNVEYSVEQLMYNAIVTEKNNNVVDINLKATGNIYRNFYNEISELFTNKLISKSEITTLINKYFD